MDKSGNNYQARITVGGKVHCLGRFDDPKDAHFAYLAAKKNLQPFARLDGQK